MNILTAAVAREGMAIDERTVLVVAHRGPMRDGLRALLEALLQEPILIADDLSGIPTVAPEFGPTVALLDSDAPGSDVANVLQWMSGTYPKTCCVALVSDASQERAAKEAGADGVLVKGFSTKRLYETVHRLLSLSSVGEYPPTSRYPHAADAGNRGEPGRYSTDGSRLKLFS